MISENSFEYEPERIYTLEEFEGINDWLKDHNIWINEMPISHFERDAEGKLSPQAYMPIYTAAFVAEIGARVCNWKYRGGLQKGVVTLSKTFYKLCAGPIVTPKVAFTSIERVMAYCSLTEDQLELLNGAFFSPTFVVEVEDLSAASGHNLESLTRKFMQTYFPAGVKLGWLIDTFGKMVYVFKRDQDGQVRRHQQSWFAQDGKPTVVDGHEVLPGFKLKFREVGERVLAEASESESTDDDDDEIICPKCPQTFHGGSALLRHFKKNHSVQRKKTPKRHHRSRLTGQT